MIYLGHSCILEEKERRHLLHQVLIRNAWQCYNRLDRMRNANNKSSNFLRGVLTDKTKIEKEFKDCYQQLTDYGGKGKKKPETSTNVKETLPEDRLLILGELGLQAALHDFLEIGKNCADLAQNAKTLQTRILSEYTRAEIIVRSLGSKRNKQTQAVIQERVKSLRMFEKALSSAKSIDDDKNLVELGCTLIWNNCLPMLQVRYIYSRIDSAEKFEKTYHENIASSINRS
jgi:hypothetical protein